jgi:tight adherence protein B
VIDLLAAGGTALAVAFVILAVGRALSRAEASKALARLRPAGPTRDRPSRSQDGSFLSSIAARVSATRFGRTLDGHAERRYPGFAFSDVIAWGLASMIGGGLLGFLVFGGGPLVIAMTLAGPPLADRIVVRLGGRRSAKLEQQLPDAFALQAAALRAGHSTTRSLELLAREVSPPLGDEVGAAVRELELGRSLEVALGRMADRAGSRDMQLWTTAMLVHRRTGGNLSAILDVLSSRVRERAQMRAEVRALTAQGRLSGLVVGLAPLGFFLLLSATSRAQMEFLYSSPVGLSVLAMGLALQAAGFVWIRRILRVKL